MTIKTKQMQTFIRWWIDKVKGRALTPQEWELIYNRIK